MPAYAAWPPRSCGPAIRASRRAAKARSARESSDADPPPPDNDFGVRARQWQIGRPHLARQRVKATGWAWRPVVDHQPGPAARPDRARHSRGRILTGLWRGWPCPTGPTFRPPIGQERDRGRHALALRQQRQAPMPPAAPAAKGVPPPPGSCARRRFVCTSERVGGSSTSAPSPRKATRAT